MPGRFDVIRDPLWDNIRLDEAALLVLDTPAMQRLRYVRQLGHAFLVYPGATHTRFEHALGAYHLTREALAALEERGELAQVDEADCLAVRLAALLHDVGHYPFSHALEEAGFPHHEMLGVAKLGRGDLAERLDRIGGRTLAARVGALITGTSDSPLQGLISGSLDLDKIDYLSRDARMCGVPYGAVDVDRLLAAMTLVEDGAGVGGQERARAGVGGQERARAGEGGQTRAGEGVRFEVGVHEKGVSALESLLFAKYQMYRNVYWHHAVRSATCMFKRAVRSAVRGGALDAATVADATDDGLMERLLAADETGLARALRTRRLYKRALDLPATDVPPEVQSWVSDDPALLARAEDALARAAGLARGELLVDFPARSSMFEVDLPLRARGGRIERLTGAGRAGSLGLPQVAETLYSSARRLRVFTATRLERLPETLMDILSTPAGELPSRLDRIGR